MTIETAFGHGHTLDIAPWVGDRTSIQRLAFEFWSSTKQKGTLVFGSRFSLPPMA
jgi:hypothetical protein